MRQWSLFHGRLSATLAQRVANRPSIWPCLTWILPVLERQSSSKSAVIPTWPWQWVPILSFIFGDGSKYMGLFENRLPRNPMLSHHFLTKMTILGASKANPCQNLWLFIFLGVSRTFQNYLHLPRRELVSPKSRKKTRHLQISKKQI